jgi:hypothetical protein
MSNTTSDNTPTELFLDGVSTRLVLPATTTWTFTAKISAYNSTDNISAGYNIRGVIRRNNSNDVAIIGENSTEAWQEGTMYSCECTISADNTNKSFLTSVIGLPGKTIRWNSDIDVSEA